MQQDKVRIGFVGVGGMGQTAHLRNYVALPNCQVVALAEIRKDYGKRVAQRYGVPNAYTSHEEMLEKEKLDAIVSAQPFTRHGTLLPQLLEYGKPLFIEKPLAGTVENAEKVLKAMEKKNGWIMVGYHKRSDPATRYAKAEIDRLKQSAELGKFKYVRIAMPAGDWVANGFSEQIAATAADGKIELQWDPPASDMDKSTYDAYISFVNYYIHQVNLMRHLLGESYKVTYADPSGVLLAGVSASGVCCAIEMSPYVTTLDWQETAMATFEKGYVKITLPAPLAHNRPGQVEILRDPGKGVVPETIHPQMPWIHAMKQQAMNFIDAVQGKIKPPCEAHEALEDLKVARDYLKLWKGK